ncbi:MAG TPA: CHAT domain-containing protein [Thermoanaerobaculia bacterium]
MRAFWTAAGVLAGIVLCTARVRAQDRTAIEEALRTSPRLLNVQKVSALSDARAATITGSDSREDVLAWLDVGALQWRLATATRWYADGGRGFLCESVRAYQKALAILRRTGSREDPVLLDAELQYAHMMGVEYCWYSTDCEKVQWESIRLAEDVLATAARLGDRGLAARAMTVLADVYSDAIARRAQYGIPNYHEAWQLSIWNCQGCPPLKLDPPIDDRLERRVRPLLEQAVRTQWADGVWTRGLVDSLGRLSALHESQERDAAAKSLADLAAEGSAALGLRIGHDAAQLEALLAAGQAIPVTPEPPPCDPARLRDTIAQHLDAERRMLLRLLEQSTERDFRWIAGALTPEDRLFDDVVRCNVRDRLVLQNSVERVLLRRQIWRYRLTRVSRARALRDPDMLASLNELVELRRQRAEQRLMRAAPPPATDFAKWRVCLEDPEAERGKDQTPYETLEAKIADVEGRLRGASGPAVQRNIQNLWADLLASLGTDTVLVGYMPFTAAGERRVLAFVVDGAGDVTWVDVGREAEIDAQFVRYVRGGLVRDTLRPAGAVLIDPIEHRLEGKSRVLLLAAGPVRFLPWSALEDREHRPLGSRYAVSSLHWAGDARVPSAGKPRSGVTFVAPAYEPSADDANPWPRVVSPDFAPLGWSAAEIAGLARMVGDRGIPTETLSGGNATETALRRIANPSVLHIAAHGFRVPSGEPLAGDEVDPRRELAIRNGDWYADQRSTDLEPSFARTGLAFAGANQLHPPDGGDALLTATEAADLDLTDTDLVVLSGCDTGFPTLQDGSGAYDLSLAFRMAGASAVVASLWPVGDRASQVLMAELYAGLLDGLPVTRALWRAKEVLRKDSELGDPRFWAAFEVFGPDFPIWPGTARPRQTGLLRDSFDEGDPRLAWEPAQPSVPAAVRDGRFVIDTQGHAWQFATVPFAIPEKADFDLSFTVTKLGGDERSFFGLVWRYNNADSFAKFAINGNGEISITSGGGRMSAVLFSSDGPHPAVHRSNAANELRLVGTARAARFLVNGTQVFAQEWATDLPPRIGFLVNRNVVAAFDDLNIGIPDAADD